MTRVRCLGVTLALLAGVGCASTPDFECGSLADIRLIPFHGEPVDDPTYASISAMEPRSREAFLVGCIDDATLMPDPRKAPPYGGFAVGDLAMMLLSESSGIPFEDVLPAEVRARWSEQGVYAYFEYVEDASNRRALESEWRRRLARRRLAVLCLELDGLREVMVESQPGVKGVRATG